MRVKPGHGTPRPSDAVADGEPRSPKRRGFRFNSQPLAVSVHRTTTALGGRAWPNVRFHDRSSVSTTHVTMLWGNSTLGMLCLLVALQPSSSQVKRGHNHPLNRGSPHPRPPNPHRRPAIHRRVHLQRLPRQRPHARLPRRRRPQPRPPRPPRHPRPARLRRDRVPSRPQTHRQVVRRALRPRRQAQAARVGAGSVGRYGAKLEKKVSRFSWPSMLNRIRSQAHTGNVRLTLHAQQKMTEEQISLNEVLEAISEGNVLEDYPDHRREACCLLNRLTRTGRAVHVVCTTDHPTLIIITVYEPSLPKWVTPTRRRQR